MKQRSDWETYKSSSKWVAEAIEKYGEENFKFEVLFECTTKAWWTYAEINIQHKLDVLVARLADGTPEYYNKAIGAVKFVPPDLLSKEHRDKIASSLSKNKICKERMIGNTLRSKKVITPDKTFDSVRDACKYYSIAYQTGYSRVRNNRKGWRYA